MDLEVELPGEVLLDETDVPRRLLQHLPIFLGVALQARAQLAKVNAVRCALACVLSDVDQAEIYAGQALNDLPGDTLRFCQYWLDGRFQRQPMMIGEPVARTLVSESFSWSMISCGTGAPA